MFRRQTTSILNFDETFQKYRQKAFDRIKSRVYQTKQQTQELDQQEPFVLKQVTRPPLVAPLFDAVKKQLKQRYVITRNDWTATPTDYKNSVKAAFFVPLRELTATFPKNVKGPTMVIIKHSVLGKFYLEYDKYAVSNFIEDFLGTNGYVPDGYVTMKICMKKTFPAHTYL